MASKRLQETVLRERRVEWKAFDQSMCGDKRQGILVLKKVLVMGLEWIRSHRNHKILLRPFQYLLSGFSPSLFPDFTIWAVNAVYNHHPRNPKIVSFVDSYIGGYSEVALFYKKMITGLIIY